MTKGYLASPKFVKTFIDSVIDREGGYINDEADSGGATKYGITEATARRNGYYGAMQDLPLALAQDIYAREFFYNDSLDMLSPISKAITEEVFDAGVNCGTATAIKFLQRALNALNNRQEHYPDIVVDGIMGSKTQQALIDFLEKRRNMRGEAVLYNLINCLQGAYYVELVEKREKDEKWIFGWASHRLDFM